jgi:hypothetical protein
MTRDVEESEEAVLQQAGEELGQVQARIGPQPGGDAQQSRPLPARVVSSSGA